MVTLKIAKVLAVPANPPPNMMYLIKKEGEDKTDIVVTGDAVPKNALGATVFQLDIPTQAQIQGYARDTKLDGLDMSKGVPIIEEDSIEIAMGKLQAQLNSLSSMVKETVFDNIPAVFSGYNITVTKPHVRQFTWNPVTSKYERSAWNLPGILQYSYYDVPSIPGFLRVNSGTVYNSVDYPELASIVNPGKDTFKLIDTGGFFLRALDSVNSIDSVRTAGTVQENTMLNIKGKFFGAYVVLDENAPADNLGAFISSVYIPAVQQQFDGIPSGSNTWVIDFDASKDPDAKIGSEVRPHNLAFPLWISY